MSETSTIRQKLFVRGIVQGVGFRPFVYTLAQKMGLRGQVGNNSAGVFIEVEGNPDAIAKFVSELRASPPPLAMIESITVEPQPARGDAAFVIVESESQPQASTPISPDICVCEDCLREMRDPSDRRHGYPFINCTNCGPRFTIIKDVPYDRPFTTMQEFALCPSCAAEYHDPANRRFHAQPVACPTCGPHVWLERLAIEIAPGEPLADRPPARTEGVGAGRRSAESLPEATSVAQKFVTIAQRDDAIQHARRALREGKIVAIKGIGGFHLACDATNDAAVAELRRRKGRAGKPLAVMAADLAAAQAIAKMSEAEEKLLASKERPIVLLPAVDGALAAQVAPGNASIGVMLPYTPLHYLLFDEDTAPAAHPELVEGCAAGVRVLVMTSGNLSDEPICKDNDEARERLAGIADLFLMHNRDIHVWCDDSVVRVFDGHELPVRRSRGYAPYPIRLNKQGPCVLGVGGELKATFCLTKGEYAYLSQHIGDMENLETMQAFERAFDHFSALFRARPEHIACDLHPGYLSTRLAREMAQKRDVPLIQVQHHHAHIASVMAEHNLGPTERVIGIALDGTGAGTDGAIWGGEVLIASYASFERFAHLKYVPLPGGDAAIKRPYRAALAHLFAAGIAWDEDLACAQACPPAELRVLRQQLERNLNCAPTSSMGRLFDAAAALIGIRQTVSYEAQAAIEMESLAGDLDENGYAFGIERQPDDTLIVDPAPMWNALITDIRMGVPKPALIAWFHAGVADLILKLARRAREETRLSTVALSGGVFQNTLLLGMAVRRLRDEGFTPRVHRRVPPNDGGLALGQVAVALAQSYS
ncbi:MAG TPA: carbamoyltransferase HypF [Thermoflexales bacterium]|nr:carbamoyltransferase HypF [Thermoflexales bacterium]